MPPRLWLPALLVLATALFAAGALAEHHSSSAEPAAPAAEQRETADEHAAERRVAGVDAESTPLVLLGVAAGLGLAALAVHPRTRTARRGAAPARRARRDR